MSVSLTTVEDIETALGRSATGPTEEAQWEQYIRTVSAFVDNYCDNAFTFIEDDVVRYDADASGVIILGGGPVSDVTLIANWRTGAEITSAEWNGIDKIRYLLPLQVVDVTYTHGYDTVPDDIEGLTREAILGVLGLGATGPLKSLAVGDTTEVYATRGSGTYVTLSAGVLDRYTRTEGTWALGGYDSDYQESRRNLPLL